MSTRTADTGPQVQPSAASATLFSFIRTPLLLLGTVAAGGILALAGLPWQVAPTLSRTSSRTRSSAWCPCCSCFLGE